MFNNNLLEARILIVDDQDANVSLLEGLLKKQGFSNLRGLTDSRKVVDVFREWDPDLILLDLMMPHMDGFAVMKALRARIPDGDYRPILILTADVDAKAKTRALSNGALDFLTKPFDAVEAILRIRNLLQTRTLHLQLQERAAELKRLNIELQHANRAKDEFLANMSHELRTPLNAIIGLSESLEEQTVGSLNEKQQKYIHTISENGHHLLDLINDILDLAKIETGQFTLDYDNVEVGLICESSLRMIKQLAQKKSQEIVSDVDANLDLIWADKRRLKQMIVNLLSNAVKFTPERGRIGLEARGDREANTVTFTVWDTGIGIKEEDLPRLFRPFVQLKSDLSQETAGTGLGLALVAEMVRLHGGSVSAESQPSKGSRFSITLPWESALSADSTSRRRITGKFRAVKPEDKDKRQTILLVEDTEHVIMVIRDYLEYVGYEVEVARNGADGIARAKQVHPDLILMDIQMPEMDGLEATQRLRTEAEFEHTPIIALTALAMKGDREQSLAVGMDEYISKPVNLKTMIEIIQSLLSENDQTKS